jgi:protein ImuB
VDRLACVSVPALPLQLLLLVHPDWRNLPTAVVDRDEAQGRILWVNEEAWRARLRPGMRYTAALSLCTELRAGVVGEREITDQLSTLLSALRVFSPHVEASTEEPGVFWVDASKFELLFPDLEKWAGNIQTALIEFCLHAIVVVGFTRFGTYAVARADRINNGARGPTIKLFTSIVEERQAARAVPLERLDLTSRLLEQLASLGIHSVGDFATLPGHGIGKRFGRDAAKLHELATESRWAPLIPTPEVEALTSTLTLDDPVFDTATLTFLARQMLPSLLGRAVERCQAVTALELDLTLERGPNRVVGSIVRPAEPTLQESVLIDLVRLRLESLKLSSGATELKLTLETVAASPRQVELFEKSPGRDLDAAGRALARLRAELGEDAVVTAVICEGHLPEARFRWAPWKQLVQAAPSTVHRPPLVRRIRSHSQPLPTHIMGTVLGSVPGTGSPRTSARDEAWNPSRDQLGHIRELAGPYVVSGGWWRREIHRAYHFAETDRGEILWVYYDRERRRWFLQGRVE